MNEQALHLYISILHFLMPFPQQQQQLISQSVPAFLPPSIITTTVINDNDNDNDNDSIIPFTTETEMADIGIDESM